MIIGNFPCKKSLEWYTPPADWPNIDNCPDAHIQLILSDTVLATYAFICTTTAGQYSINWGDGTTTLHDSGATAEHTYAIGTGQACSRGYTTFVVDITAVDAGAGLTSFKVTPHSLATQNQYWGILGCVMNCATLTDLAEAFSASGAVSCRVLEFVTVLRASAVTTATGMCRGCASLQKVDVNSMTNLLNATLMFANCVSLQRIDLTGMEAITAANSMFNNCSSLNDVIIGNMPNTTLNMGMFVSCAALKNIDISGVNIADGANFFNACTSLQTVKIGNINSAVRADGMFNSCYSLQRVEFGGMKNISTANNLFNGCYSLQEISGLENLGFDAGTVNLTTAFTSCEQLTELNLCGAKASKIGVAGAAGKLNKVTSIILNPNSLFEGSSPQIDISYCAFDATQLNALFTSLPTLSGKTIKITGCTGADNCDRSIATAKGWTVTG